MGTLRKDVFVFMTISSWILLRMKNILDKIYRENQITHFMFDNFSSKIVLWQSVEKYGGDTEALNNACWMSEATSMHTP